ncbi:MAG TPA: hypothetical protein VID04_15240 [Methylomirabilota bacterium]
MTALPLAGAFGLGLLLVMATAGPAAAQREHFQLKLGAVYEQGDFGTSEETRTLTAPATLRYLGERFDFAVTTFFVYVDSPQQVVFVDGSPNVGGQVGDRQTEYGLGDTVLKFRYYAYDDPGPDRWWLPGLTPFLKLKIPTGDDKKGLSTGKTDGGLGLEFDKQFKSFFILGDISYTFMGDPPDQNFRDRPGASLGVGVPLGPKWSIVGMIDWRRALVQGTDDPLELLGILTARLTPTITLAPYAFMGLTDGTSDWGVGFEVSYRFGRW